MTTSELKSKLSKSIDHLNHELAQIRTGRATPALIENLPVMAYGTRMTLKEVGSITVLDSQNLLIVPWDKSLVKEAGKAITDSGMNLNPVVDSTQVRVPIPPLTEDRRKEFARLVATKVEEVKNSMRSVRQDAMKDIEKAYTDKTIGEDEKFTQKDEVEKIVKEFVTQSEELGETKKEELMRV